MANSAECHLILHPANPEQATELMRLFSLTDEFTLEMDSYGVQLDENAQTYLGQIGARVDYDVTSDYLYVKFDASWRFPKELLDWLEARGYEHSWAFSEPQMDLFESGGTTPERYFEDLSDPMEGVSEGDPDYIWRRWELIY